MPATFAHPAAILPLARFCPRRLDFPALVIGSIAPDMGYFARRFDVATAAHSFLGSVGFCVPAGATLYMTFLLLREPLTFLLPNPHRATLFGALTRCGATSLQRIPTIVGSLLLGAWTHIVWDSFTHANSWLAQRLQALRETLFTVGLQPLPITYFLQQLSTVFGVILLAIAYRKWLRRNKTAFHGRQENDRWRYVLWAGLLILPLVVALPAASHRATRFAGYLAIRVFVFRAAIYYIATLTPLVVAVAVTVSSINRKRRLP